MAVKIKRRKDRLQDLVAATERRQLALVESTYRQLTVLMDDKATEVAFLYAKRKLINDRFLPKDILDTIEKMSRDIDEKAQRILIEALGQSIQNSVDKNNRVELLSYSQRRLTAAQKAKLITDPFKINRGVDTAVQAFARRKNQGLNLSQRVWKVSNSWKKVVTDTLKEGIASGQSAKRIAAGEKPDGSPRELKKRLQSALRDYKGGAAPKGVYKSPYKNALRVARNEINQAHDDADHERWQRIPTIIGFQVNLSNRHPKYDMCDSLKGKYPKSFHFKRWHVNCLCAAIPLLASEEIRNQIMDYKLGLTSKAPTIPEVKEIPAASKKWIADNADRMKGWKSKPYWVEANKSVVNSIAKSK